MFSTDIKIEGNYGRIIKKYSKYPGNGNPIEFNVFDANGDKIDTYVFSSYFNCFTTAGLIGLINNKKREKINDSSVAASIMLSKINPNKNFLERIYQTMVFLSTENSTADEKIKKAFSVRDEEEEKAAENLFLSYVYGGLEIIDDQFKDCISTEDIMDKIANLYRDYELDKLELL